jgi:VWFA-related protein
MRRGWRLLAAAVAAPVVLAARSPASQTPQRPEFRALTNFVEVDASVLDRQRRPIRGLTAGDFTVTEDGRPQQIVTFAEVHVPDPVVHQTAWMRDVAPDVKTNIVASDRRLVVMVLEDGIPGMDRYAPRVKEIARRVVDRLGAGDLASIIFTRDIKRSLDFTGDRSRLLEVIDLYAPGLSGQGGARNAIEALRKVAEFLADAPQRRKALIYVSAGWAFDPHAPGNAGADARFLQQRMEEAFDKARLANVNIYPVDPSGLTDEVVAGSEGVFTGPPAAAATPDPGLAGSLSGPRGLAREFLLTLATNTGGLAIINNNEFTTGVTQIFRENGSYYLLGYQSPNTARDGKTRRIAVSVDVPGATVRARNGYTVSADADRAAATSPVVAALSGLLPKSDLGMQVSVTPFALPGRRETALATVLAIRQPAPTDSSATKETCDVLVTAYDPLGKHMASRRYQAQLTLRPGASPRVQYELVSQLDLRPGRYQLRFAASSTLEGKSGSIYYDVVVPDLNRGGLVLSGAAIATSPSVASAPKQALATLIPIVPTARRDFFSDDQVTAFVRVHQNGRAAVAPVAMTSRVLDAAGETVFVDRRTIAAADFAATRITDFRLDLAMTGIRPGSHVLVIEAQTPDGRTARRDVRFQRR